MDSAIADKNLVSLLGPRWRNYLLAEDTVVPSPTSSLTRKVNRRSLSPTSATLMDLLKTLTAQTHHSSWGVFTALNITEL